MKQAIAILMIISLLIAGCGGKTDNATEDAVKAGKETVKIGMTLPMTGDLSFIGQTMIKSTNLALNENKDTKYDYEFVVEDDKLDPKTTSTTATKLLTVDNVDAIISVSSGTGNVVSPIAESNKRLHIGAASDANVAKGEYNFIHWTPPDEEAKGWVEEAARRGHKRIAILMVQQQGFLAMRDSVMKYLPGTGLEIVDEQIFSPGEKDFKTMILKAEEKKPDVYLLGAFEPEIPILYKQMIEAQVKADLTSIESFELAKDPSQFEGRWYTNAAEGTSAFNEMYKKEYNENPQMGSPNAYDMINLIVYGFEKAGKDSSGKPAQEDVIAELMKLKGFDSAMGKIDVGPDGIVNSKAAVKMIKGGKPVVMDTKELPAKDNDA